MAASVAHDPPKPLKTPSRLPGSSDPLDLLKDGAESYDDAYDGRHSNGTAKSATTKDSYEYDGGGKGLKDHFHGYGYGGGDVGADPLPAAGTMLDNLASAVRKLRETCTTLHQRKLQCALGSHEAVINAVRVLQQVEEGEGQDLSAVVDGVYRLPPKELLAAREEAFDFLAAFCGGSDGEGAEAVKFNVPISTDGDSLSRYLVRLEELNQSVGIIEQLIDDIPSGPIDSVADSKLRIPDKSEVYGSIEGTIQLFELTMHNRGVDAPVGEMYGCIESPNGELGYYVVADGTKYPWRARTRPPSYINYSVFAKLIEGHLVSDVVAVLGSLNIIAAELDR